MKNKILLCALALITFSANSQVKKPANKPKVKHTVTATTEKHQMVQLETEYGNVIIKLYNETPLHRDNFVKLVKDGFYDSLLFHRVIKYFMIQGGDPLSKNADSVVQLGNGDMGYKIPAEFNPKLFHKKGALAAARDNNPEKASSGCQFYIVQGKTLSVQELESVMNNKNLAKKQELLYKFYQSDSIQKAVGEIQALGDKDKLKSYIEKLQVTVDSLYNKGQQYTYTPMQVKAYLEDGGTPHLDGDYTVFGEVVSGLDVVDKIAAVTTRSSDARPLKDVRMKIHMYTK